MDMTESKEREAYRKDNDMNEFDKRAEAYMRSVMNNDGDVFTRADLYEYIMDAWKAGYVEGNTTRNYFICNDCPKQKAAMNESPKVIFMPTATARE